MKKKYTCPLSFHDLVNSSTPLHSNYATGMQIVLERVYNKKEKNNGKKAAARSQCTDATNTKPSHQTRRVHKISVNLGDLGVVHFTVLPKTFLPLPAPVWWCARREQETGKPRVVPQRCRTVFTLGRPRKWEVMTVSEVKNKTNTFFFSFFFLTRCSFPLR